MVQIQKNATKYSGLPLKALIHLVSTHAPVNELRKREVWKELFYRYFMDGRTFNLYDLLRKNPKMFANTIGWELQRVDVEIPVSHSESFMSNLLEFIDFINQHVLETGIHFDWQLHELKGMKSMIERLRDAKIQDSNLRQKINLFIDKINAARKTELIQIEESITHDKGVDSKTSNELVIKKEKHELMKQELKRLSIPVSKMTKKQWESAISQFDMYYPEDQEKLIKQGLRKFSFYDHSNLALLAFKLNLEWKIPGVYMDNLLSRAKGYVNEPERLFGSQEGLYEKVKELYFAASGSTDEGWYVYSSKFLDNLDGDFAKKKLRTRTLEAVEKVYPFVKEFTGKKLSEVLSIKTEDLIDKRLSVFGIEYSKNDNSWIVKETRKEVEPISVFELIYKATKYMKGEFDGSRLVHYDIEYLSNSEINISDDVPYQYHQMIRDFCNFPATIIIDNKTYETFQDPCVRNMLPTGFEREGRYLLHFLKHKFNSGNMTDSELMYLFKTSEGQKAFKSMTEWMREMQGWLKEREDFIGRFFDRTLYLFDFTVDEDRKLFFNLPIRINQFFQGYGYLKKEYLQWIAEKLITEAPHEYSLISEYFSDINETYEEYKVHDMFEYLSDFERLLLEKEGIKTGEHFKHQGYKEREVYFTSEEAMNKFVFEYFQKYYETTKE